MKYPILMFITVFILCGGAWATSPEPERLANESLVDSTATAAVTNITETLKIPFLKEDDTLYTVMSLAFNQKVRLALNTIHYAFKYMAVKIKKGIDRFERNMEVLRDLHRRREEFLNMAMRVKKRRFRKVKPVPPLQLSPQITPLQLRSMIEATLLYRNDTAGLPNNIFVAAA